MKSFVAFLLLLAAFPAVADAQRFHPFRPWLDAPATTTYYTDSAGNAYTTVCANGVCTRQYVATVATAPVVPAVVVQSVVAAPAVQVAVPSVAGELSALDAAAHARQDAEAAERQLFLAARVSDAARQAQAAQLALVIAKLQAQYGVAPPAAPSQPVK